MTEELLDRDMPSVRDETGQPVLQGVIERQCPFIDELEHDSGNEGLRDARDPKAHIRSDRTMRRDVGDTSGERSGHRPFTKEDRDPRDACIDEVPKLLLDLVRSVLRGMR